MDRVVKLDACVLRVVDGTWPFAGDNFQRINENWQRRSEENASMFNGVIHMMAALTTTSDRLDAEFIRTDFKSYLFWRERGFPEAGVRDGFGSALIRSREGHVILGRQRAGNVNAGLAYLPGGFIDARDVAADGAIDIDASIAREVVEETGLAGHELACEPGYLVTFSGPLVSIAREFRSSLGSEQLRLRILNHIAGDPGSELTDAVVVRGPVDAERSDVPPYARRLLQWLYASAGERATDD